MQPPTAIRFGYGEPIDNAARGPVEGGPTVQGIRRGHWPLFARALALRRRLLISSRWRTDRRSSEIDADLRSRLDALAASERTSTQELAKRALTRLVADRKRPASLGPPDDDPYAPLRAMIGMIEDGPTDSSIYHDGRPGDPL